MEHLEFIDQNHFEKEYHRKWAEGLLGQYIDFCWETDFDRLLDANRDGFSDVLFPNIGYTYLINLGTPFVMQLRTSSLQVKNDGFLPRHHYITCHHSVGNKLFGIKFKVCPIVFEKDVDFSEYKEFIYPLAYLIDRNIVSKVKNAASFSQRADIVFDHYENLIKKYTKSLNYVTIVTHILTGCGSKGEYNKPIEELAEDYKISSRTLQRYFRATTSFSSKEAMQTMRIRNATARMTSSPSSFSYTNFGYYDYGHFLKHLQQFTGEKYFKLFQSFCKIANSSE